MSSILLQCPKVGPDWRAGGLLLGPWRAKIGDPLGPKVGPDWRAGGLLLGPWRAKIGDPLGFFNIHSVAKHQKN